jgi:hypothetical protein
MKEGWNWLCPNQSTNQEYGLRHKSKLQQSLIEMFIPFSSPKQAMTLMG